MTWARSELQEADRAEEAQASRKHYNTTIHAKAAVECLVDWYLRRLLLQHTIPVFAGVAQKLQALDSGETLGISFNLFNEIVFEPRNRGVHRFELVTATEARRSFELAQLTVTNCVHHVKPEQAPIFYGEIDILTGATALEALGRPGAKVVGHTVQDGVFFRGIGGPGKSAVLFDHHADGGRVCVLTELKEGHIECRFSRVRDRLRSEQMRAIYNHLEGCKPRDISIQDDHRDFILDTLVPSRKKRVNKVLFA